MTARWHKASKSGSTSNCVELTGTGVVRDSKNPAGPTLTVNLRGLLAAIKSGRLTG